MKKLDIAPALRQIERFIGFTIPRNGKFAVCDHDEVVWLTIEGSAGPEVSDEHPYKFAENNPDFVGIVFDGLPKNEPVFRAGSAAISYDFDPTQSFVGVGYEIAGTRGVLEFRTFSGD